MRLGRETDMQQGRSKSGEVVHADEALRNIPCTCLLYGSPLELRRGARLKYFAHRRRHPGTNDCILYSPPSEGDEAQTLAEVLRRQPGWAAYKRGRKIVILPKANAGDLERIPREILDGLDVRLVSTASEALKAALTH